MWTKRIESLTKVNADKDIAPVYGRLICLLDDNHFVGKLSKDKQIWQSM